MGKFTDDFFSFPIKVYDGFSLKKALEEEDKGDTEAALPIDWVMGWVKIPAKDLHKLMWHDGFSRERNVKDVADEGFDLTIVVSEYHGEFVSTWPRKKFEQKLDEFMEKWEASKPSSGLPWLLSAQVIPNSPEGHDETGKLTPKD